MRRGYESKQQKEESLRRRGGEENKGNRESGVKSRVEREVESRANSSRGSRGNVKVTLKSISKKIRVA